MGINGQHAIAAGQKPQDFGRGGSPAAVGHEDCRPLGIAAGQLDGRYGPRSIQEKAAARGFHALRLSNAAALTPGPSPACGRGGLSARTVRVPISTA